MKKLLAVALVAWSCSWVRAAETLEALKGGDPFAGLSVASVLAAPAPVTAAKAAPKQPSSGQALPNFAQVTPALFRSGQPNQQGVQQLAAKGVKTILKLNTQDPAESSWASAAGVDFVDQPMSPSGSPSYAEVDQALAVLNDPARQPVLVHCHLGRDRTGTVIAAYRVTHGMSVADAVSEALSYGYGSPGFSDLTTWLNGYLAQRGGN